MSESVDFTRLSENWLYWAELSQLKDLSVSSSCDDCEIEFSSNDSAVHLRRDDIWWIVDTVNDRRQRQNDTARFSAYALAEKYLIWIWSSTARSTLRAPVLGAALYQKGFAPGVETTPVSEGVYEVRSPDGRAVLPQPYATIFSHVMGLTHDEIQRMARSGLGG